MTVNFLFLESIGTPELILIAFVALIIFGPRKLPQIGRTIGKYTTEFKRASNDFRRSWEYEVEMAEREEKFVRETNAAGNDDTLSNNFTAVENTIGRTSSRRQKSDNENFAGSAETSLVNLPEIQPINQNDFGINAVAQTEEATEKIETLVQQKREWL